MPAAVIRRFVEAVDSDALAPESQRPRFTRDSKLTRPKIIILAAGREHLFGMHSRLVVFRAVLSEEDRTFYRIADDEGEDDFHE
ncbi:MAG: hypothetical protein ACYDC3_13010 [Candidatus Binataceae bacterium]